MRMAYGYSIPALVRDVLVREGLKYDEAVRISQEISDRMDEEPCGWVTTYSGRVFKTRGVEDALLRECTGCGNSFHPVDLRDGPDEKEYCPHCFDRRWHTCSRCGRAVEKFTLRIVPGAGAFCEYCCPPGVEE